MELSFDDDAALPRVVRRAGIIHRALLVEAIGECIARLEHRRDELGFAP